MERPGGNNSSRDGSPAVQDRKRRTVVIDLAAEEDREEAERIRREKRERLNLESTTLLKSLDYGGNISLSRQYRLAKGLYETDTGKMVACIDHHTDEFWALSDVSEENRGPFSGVLRFDSDWNALELPKSLRLGIYFCPRRCGQMLRDDSETQTTVYASEPHLIVSCSARNVLYVIARNVVQYSKSTNQIARLNGAIISISMVRDAKVVTPVNDIFAGDFHIFSACATNDGTLHIVSGSGFFAKRVLSFDLGEDGNLQSPYSFDLSNGNERSEQFWNNRAWEAVEISGARVSIPYIANEVRSICSFAVHEQHLHLIYTTSNYAERWYQNRWLSARYTRGGTMQLTAGQVNRQGLILSDDSSSPLSWDSDMLARIPLDTEGPSYSLTTPSYSPASPAHPAAVPNRDSALSVPIIFFASDGRAALFYNNRLFIESRDLARRYSVGEASYVHETKETDGGQAIAGPGTPLLGSQLTRFIVPGMKGKLFERIHTEALKVINARYKLMLDEQRVPLMVRQVSWRALLGVLEDMNRMLEVQALAAVIYDSGISGWIAKRDIAHGSVLYAAFTNAPSAQNQHSRIAGLLLVSARPQSRGVFFQGPNGPNHAATIFHPYDGLEVELLSTQRTGSQGAGELLINTAKVLAYRLGYGRLNLSALTAAVGFYIKLGMRTRYGEQHDLFLSTLDAKENSRNVTEVLPDDKSYQEYGRWMSVVLKHMPGTKYPGLVLGAPVKYECGGCWPNDDSGLVALSFVTDARVQYLVAQMDPSPLKQMFPREFYLPLSKDPRTPYPTAPDVANLSEQMSTLAVQSDIHLY